jgi:ABC-type Fe3+/spermidine/putrescine transport system ATPase subunit
MADAHLTLDRVTVPGRDRPILDRLTLALPRGQTLALLGPEGSGKSAALLTLAGFMRPGLGTIILAGREITTARPEARNIAMVFQEDALFPHLSVLDNVAFGLKMRGLAAAARRDAARGALAALGAAVLAERHPGRLDATERRLVALARAVACRPTLLLIDEPAAPADAPRREAVRRVLRAALGPEHITAILATHDRAAAFALADVVALLRDGRLEQIGTPMDLFERPATRFAAGFTGPCNLLPATLLGHPEAREGAGLAFAAGTASAPPRPGPPPGRVLVCLRPHQLRIDEDGPLRGPIEQIDYQGALTRVTLRAPEGPVVADLIQARPDIAVGSHLSLGWTPADAWLLPWEA